MKNLKLSFALIVAVLAVGFTVASKASSFGSRVLTACFTDITVTNGSSPSVISDALQCQDAISLIALKPFVTNASLSNSLADEQECPPEDAVYCCVKLVQTTDTRAALLNLGEGGSFRYRIASPVQKDVNVFCKP